jgi:uncharacterized ferredoxin-like protein
MLVMWSHSEDFAAEINNQICRLGEAKVFDDMVIVIDPGDMRKKCALKMENLGSTRAKSLFLKGEQKNEETVQLLGTIADEEENTVA